MRLVRKITGCVMCRACSRVSSLAAHQPRQHSLASSFYLRLRLSDAVYNINIPLLPKLWRFHPSTLALWVYMNTRQVVGAAPACRTAGFGCVPRATSKHRTPPLAPCLSESGRVIGTALVVR
mmetsp:Transcript_16931/g.55168  ORF Transcript_16931/g.55168 Transcript_16931/m.55168 type:complete len:122 (+) Transcript_16931:664-1029(+)